MSIVDSTARYEEWLGTVTLVDKAALHAKHEAMSTDDFSFLRATYYRWEELVGDCGRELADLGPRLLGVGDLHIQNFGAWRDGEGRLVWGIDDFDEADEGLPMAIDLTRLATSALISKDVNLPAETICSMILEGYEKGLSEDSVPFVLEDRHTWLRNLALSALKPPERFWKRWLTEKTVPIPLSEVDGPGAIEALAEAYPDGASPETYRKTHPDHPKGLGSLGRKRFFAYNPQWRGGPIAREVKAVVPPATRVAKGGGFVSFVDTIQRRAIRSADSNYRLHEKWVCKAIMANTGRIEMIDLDEGEERERLLCAMGQETANLHRGTSGDSVALRAALDKMKDGRFRKVTEALADAVRKDARQWRSHWQTIKETARVR